MVVYNVLNKLFFAPTAISLLRELNNRNSGLSGRALARAVNITPQTAHNTLSNLEALKIVTREFVGRTHYFKLNREHYIAKNILNVIFEKEMLFVENIYNNIKKSISKDTVSVILYGSVARKEETIESDFDICIVYDENKDVIEGKINRLRDILYNNFGITLAPYYIKTSEFALRAKNNKTPVNNIIKEGKVISGRSINRLING